MPLVTGCAGFVGSHFVERLLKEGHVAVGVDCSTGDGNFQFIEGDINRSEKLNEALRGADYVFHQAGQTGARIEVGLERFVR